MLTVEADALAKALTATKVGSSHLPILTGVRLIAADRTLSCWRSDLDSILEARLPCSSDELDVVVPADVLSSYASNVDGPLAIARKDDRLIVEGRGSHVALAMFDVRDWPKAGHVDGDDQEIDEVTAASIRSVAYAAETDKKRPELCAIHFNGECVEATDAYRAAQAPCSLPEMLVPAAFATLQPGRITVDDRWITWRGDGIARTHRLVNGNYPPNLSAFYTPPSHSIRVEVASLVRAIKTIAGANGVEKFVDVDPWSDSLTVRSVGNEKADGTAAIDADCDFDFGLRFYEKFLLDLLGAASSETVEIEVRDAMKPVSIVNADGSRHLVMPTRRPA